MRWEAGDKSFRGARTRTPASGTGPGQATSSGQQAMNDNHSRKYSFLLKGGNHQTVLLGVNSIDVSVHISQQLLFNICSFSRCLAQWTKCYGNLSVLCREVLPVWMMVARTRPALCVMCTWNLTLLPGPVSGHVGP